MCLEKFLNLAINIDTNKDIKKINLALFNSVCYKDIPKNTTPFPVATCGLISVYTCNFDLPSFPTVTIHLNTYDIHVHFTSIKNIQNQSSKSKILYLNKLLGCCPIIKLV